MTEASKYVKDYKNWHKLKSQIDSVGVEKFFHEQEIWWCSVGVNVGYEIDGKNTNFERPILIFRKFNKGMFWGVPLTSKVKEGKFYFTFDFKDRKSTVILSQLRILSSKRLIRKMGNLNKEQFGEVEKMILKLISTEETKNEPLAGLSGAN